MRRWFGNVNANTVMAVAALVTSVVAVVVSWDEARLMRRSQEASFMPLMDVRATVSTAPDDLRVAIDVRNTPSSRRRRWRAAGRFFRPMTPLRARC